MPGCRPRRRKVDERKGWKMMKGVDGKLYDKHSKSIGTTDLGLGLLILRTTLDLMTNYIALIIVTDDFDTPEKVLVFVIFQGSIGFEGFVGLFLTTLFQRDWEN